MPITKAMRYEIVKPIDCTWEEFGKVINSLRYKCARMGNLVIQKCWEWENYRVEHKRTTGNYPGKEHKQPNYYAILRERFPDVGTGIVNQIVQYALLRYKNDKKDISLLKRSVPSFRDNMPICLNNQAYVIREADGYEIDARLMPNDSPQCRYKFIIKFGDRSKRAILNRIISGGYKQGVLQLVRDRHKKWYAVISYTFEPEPITVLEGIMEVSISDEVIKMTKGKWINEMPITYAKQAIAAIDKRLEQLRIQKRWRGQGRIGHGRKKVFEPMQAAEERKANYKATANHNWSRIIIDTALKMKCNTINLTGEIANWNNRDLQDKVKYKAAENGISVSSV